MARLLHTGDVHLGVKLSGLGRAGDKVRASLKSAFSKMIDTAISEQVDAFLIAGDLFDSNRISSSLVRFTLSEIERLGNIPCVILPGTHDCLEEGSVYLSLSQSDKPSNLHILMDRDTPFIRFDDRGLVIYGMPNVARTSTTNPIASVSRQDLPGCHVLMAHGSYMIPGKTSPDDHPFSLDDIENSGFDYIAVGHWHSAFVLPTTRVKAAYCGSPETIAFDQSGAGHYYLVDTSGGVHVDKRRVGKTEWMELDLSAASFKYTIELERELSKHAGEDKLLRVRLSGLASSDSFVNLEELHEHLSDKFLSLSVSDRTETVPDDLKGLNLPPTTILGQFISIVSESVETATDPEEKQLYTESLKTGFAMLSGKDVL
jgi:DNA repair exonuclease SbcCD nuclease subunit